MDEIILIENSKLVKTNGDLLTLSEMRSKGSGLVSNPNAVGTIVYSDVEIKYIRATFICIKEFINFSFYELFFP